MKERVLKTWIPAFAGMTTFAFYMLLSMKIAHASPPLCMLYSPEVNMQNAIKQANLIIIGEPTTTPPQILHPNPTAPLAEYEDISVKQVLRGNYDKSTIRLMSNSAYTTDPWGFGRIKVKSIIAIYQSTDSVTKKTTYEPAGSLACGGMVLEMEGNNVSIPKHDKTQALSLKEFIRQYITK